MVLVRQPKTAGFRLISGYEYIIDWPSRYEVQDRFKLILMIVH